jgi:hypothetical protein
MFKEDGGLKSRRSSVAEVHEKYICLHNTRLRQSYRIMRISAERSEGL